jgi:hypothetical protein
MKNQMKKISIILLGIFAIILAGCSGSDTYRGKWKATDANGTRYELAFEAKNLTVIDSTGKSEKYEYTQNSVEIKNSVTTYGIKLSDGRGYQINFPNSKDESVGLIKDDNGSPIYTISRKNYIKYQDIYQLK